MLGWDIDSGKLALGSVLGADTGILRICIGLGRGDVRGSDDNDKLSGPLTGKTGGRVKLVVRSPIGLFAPGFLFHVMDCRARPTWLGNSLSAKYYSVLFRQFACQHAARKDFTKLETPRDATKNQVAH